MLIVNEGIHAVNIAGGIRAGEAHPQKVAQCFGTKSTVIDDHPKREIAHPRSAKRQTELIDIRNRPAFVMIRRAFNHNNPRQHCARFRETGRIVSEARKMFG